LLFFPLYSSRRDSPTSLADCYFTGTIFIIDGWLAHDLSFLLGNSKSESLAGCDAPTIIWAWSAQLETKPCMFQQLVFDCSVLKPTSRNIMAAECFAHQKALFSLSLKNERSMSFPWHPQLYIPFMLTQALNAQQHESTNVTPKLLSD
jgi:hypothetical protein